MKRFLAAALILGLFANVSQAEGLRHIADALQNGQWGWPDGDNTCNKNPQTISFTDDLSQMTIEWQHTHSAARYRILSWDDTSFSSLIEGEDRRSDAGDLVMWQLKLKSPAAYWWRPTDWPGYANTRVQILCTNS